VTGRWFPRWRWIATEIDRRLVSDQNLKWFDAHFQYCIPGHGAMRGHARIGFNPPV
jgi:hypothetical protein